MIGGRFANVLKNVSINNELAKARCITQGFSDYIKPFVVYNTPTLRQTSNKVLFSCAIILSMRICLIDITEAHLQSKDKLTREVYIQVKNEDKDLIKVGPHELLRLNKPLYGMCNSGDYWGATLAHHVRNYLRIIDRRSFVIHEATIRSNYRTSGELC